MEVDGAMCADRAVTALPKGVHRHPSPVTGSALELEMLRAGLHVNRLDLLC